MVELKLINPIAVAHFNFVCDICDRFIAYDLKNRTNNKSKFHPKKYSFLGHFMEEILKIEWAGTPRKKHQSKAVDFNLPDGTSVQLKTSHCSRKEITCTYTGTEKVDKMLVVDVNTDTKQPYVLYYGPFKEFVKYSNSHSRVLPKDGHIMIKKSIIARANKMYGTTDFASNPHILDLFI